MPEFTVDFASPIPLFPLPGAVLLPHGAMPLHIFEPRYRAMVGDALAGSKLIAMASIDEPAWARTDAPDPPLRSAVGLGVITEHQQLPDGRFYLVLQGVARASIELELDRYELDTPYRQAVLRPIDEPTLEIDLDEQRERLLRLLTRPPLNELARAGAISRWVNEEIDTATLVDVCVSALVDDGDERYDMLAEGDAMRRAAWLEQHLKQTVNSIKLAERVSKSVSEDGLFLN